MTATIQKTIDMVMSPVTILFVSFVGSHITPYTISEDALKIIDTSRNPKDIPIKSCNMIIT